MKPLYCSHGHENLSGNRFCSQCGERLELPLNQGIQGELTLGGRYRIVRELGHGGFGRTYLAEDLNRFNEPCVLKEFAPQVEGTYALEKAAELFEREAGVLYKLQHPQIPQFRELFRVKQNDQGRLFLVQDFVAGQTYRALLDTRKSQGLRFSEAEVTQLLHQILPVLGYIHSLGVIHRDISPDNLMLRSTDGLPVLIDFGGVKQVAATVASQFMASPMAIATRLGKVGYAPHEQMQGGIVYPNSDLYALGATVLTLLTGKEPQQLIDPHTLAWNWQREVSISPSLGTVLQKMLQANPSDRYQSVSAVLQALTPQPIRVAYSPPPPPQLPQTQATVAVAPARIAPEPRSTPTPATKTPSLSTTPQPSLGWFGKVMLVCGLILVAGGMGWWAGNVWIQSQIQPGDLQPSPTDQDFEDPVISPDEDSEPEPSSEFSAEEQRRKQVLRQRRTNLGIDYSFYVGLVNEAFWTQYPSQRGRQLDTGPEDARLREQWDAIAAELLTHIEQLNLSTRARRQLGTYEEADRTRWKNQANQVRISSRSLYDLADARFFHQFSEQQGQDFINQPMGQIWQAIVADTVQALLSGDALNPIVFEPGAIGKQIRGSLRPGGGKAFTAQLSKGQVMKVELSTDEEALFSIYSPTGRVVLLEDSRSRRWSGELPESGFYEFTVVSTASEPIDYQLDLTVEEPSSSQSPGEDGV